MPEITVEQMVQHKDHKLEMCKIGSELCLDCLTCNKTIVAAPAPTRLGIDNVPKEDTCSMDEGCLSCGS
jgi:hypothetical protein